MLLINFLICSDKVENENIRILEKFYFLLFKDEGSNFYLIKLVLQNAENSIFEYG